jgi:hypothetical protein
LPEPWDRLVLGVVTVSMLGPSTIGLLMFALPGGGFRLRASVRESGPAQPGAGDLDAADSGAVGLDAAERAS